MNEYMKLAIKEAKKSYKIGDVPVGAIIVNDRGVIAKAHNLKHKSQIATKHAEILAIEKACKKLKTWRLEDCVMYVTLEPCLMCCGAIIESRLKKVIYATKSDKFGYVSSIDNLKSEKNNHEVEFELGDMQKESVRLLTKFFETKRNKGS